MDFESLEKLHSLNSSFYQLSTVSLRPSQASHNVPHSPTTCATMTEPQAEIVRFSMSYEPDQKTEDCHEVFGTTTDI